MTSTDRLFSSGNSAVTAVRTRLNADEVNKLMSLKKRHLILKSITNATSTASKPSGDLQINRSSNDLLNLDQNDAGAEQADVSQLSSDSDYYFLIHLRTIWKSICNLASMCHCIATYRS